MRLRPLLLLVPAWLAAAVLAAIPARAASPEPVGIALEGFAYPHPVDFMPVVMRGEPLRLAYMDVPAAEPANGRAVLLLHGRNFPGSYWEPVAAALSKAGYRVVIPDQIGFGKSSKPGFYLSFDDHARATAALLDKLGLATVDVVGHSMGGMLAVRFARTFPARVDHLALEAPIGLEDYRVHVPPVETERLMNADRNLSAEGYRNQLVRNYAPSDPAEVEPYVALRERIRGSGEYERWLRAFAETYQTLYREPVVHEIPLVERPTLFLMGARDFNAPGRPLAPEAARAGMGQNARHAEELAGRMKNGRAVVFAGSGHLVHLDETARFNAELLAFLGGR